MIFSLRKEALCLPDRPSEVLRPAEVRECPSCASKQKRVELRRTQVPRTILCKLDQLQSISRLSEIRALAGQISYCQSCISRVLGNMGHLDGEQIVPLSLGVRAGIPCERSDEPFELSTSQKRSVSKNSGTGRVPYPWVQQTKPGGIIITPVRADITSGPLVRFIVNRDGTATGRMVPMGVQYMEVRSQRTAGIPDDDFDWQDDTADHTTTTIKPWLTFSDIVSRWALAVALPSCRYNMKEHEFVWLHDPVSGSWASVVPDGNGRFLVRQKGIRRLWDHAESAYRWWINQGKPVGPDWIWTITPEHQTIQLGTATGQR